MAENVNGDKNVMKHWPTGLRQLAGAGSWLALAAQF